MNQILPTHAFELGNQLVALFGLVPEEELTLGQFLLRTFGTIDRLECVGMETGVPSLGRDSHGCGGEILYLLQMEVEAAGDDSQLGHLFGTATRVTGDEVGNQLLVQSMLSIHSVEYLFELTEETERGLAHQS